MTARSTSRLGSGAPSTGTITLTETTDVVTFSPGGPYSGLTVICTDDSPTPISFVFSSTASDLTSLTPSAGLSGAQDVAVGQVVSLGTDDGIPDRGRLYVKLGGAIGSKYQVIRTETKVAKGGSSGSGGAVTVTSGTIATTAADASNVTFGAKADAAAATDAGTETYMSLFKRLLGKFTTQLPASLGQKTMANSLGVVVASDQGNLPTNIAQINGVATTMGNGASGTGVQRMTLASDSTGNVATIGTSVTPGTSAAHLGKAEDAVAASGDTGVAVLAVRRDTPSSDVSAAGDYATFQVDDEGKQYVRPMPKIVTATATMAEASITSATANYTAGDVIGVVTTIANVNAANSRPCIIRNAVIADDYGKMGPVDVYLFSATVSPGVDNTAFTITDAELLTCLGVLRFPGADTNANGNFLQAVGGSLGLPIVLGASTSLFAVFVARSDNAFFTAALGAQFVMTLTVERL